MTVAPPLSAFRTTISGSWFKFLRAKCSCLEMLLLGGRDFLRMMEQSCLIFSLMLSGKSLIPYSMLQRMSSLGIVRGEMANLILLQGGLGCFGQFSCWIGLLRVYF